MKYIITLILLFTAGFIFGQDTLSYSMVYNDFKQGFTSLSEGVRQTGTEIFKMLCWKYRVKGIVDGLISIVFLISSLWFLLYSVKTIKEDAYGDWTNTTVSKIAISVILTVFASINFLGGITDCMINAFVPEASALKEILNYIK